MEGTSYQDTPALFHKWTSNWGGFPKASLASLPFTDRLAGIHATFYLCLHIQSVPGTDNRTIALGNLPDYGCNSVSGHLESLWTVCQSDILFSVIQFLLTWCHLYFRDRAVCQRLRYECPYPQGHLSLMGKEERSHIWETAEESSSKYNIYGVFTMCRAPLSPHHPNNPLQQRLLFHCIGKAPEAQRY